MSQSRRIIAIALDALSHPVLEQWMADGSLPNLARLRQQGAYGRLHNPDTLLYENSWLNFLHGQLGVGMIAQVAFAQAAGRLQLAANRGNTKALFKQFRRAIGGAGIDDDNLINVVEQRLKAAGQSTNFVLDHHAKRKTRHKNKKGRPATPLSH